MDPMSTPNIEDTSPVNTSQNTAPAKVEDTSPVKVAPARAARRRRWPVILIGVFLILFIVILGGFTGYNSGKNARLAAYNQAKTLKLATQFQMAEVDMSAGHYDTALKRVQYVINEDPSFPGAADRLAKIMMAMSATATLPPLPTASPTPAASPTPDTRGEEELYNAAKAALAANDWQKAIDTLDSLRKLSTTYQPINVDGMYYVALRNRGMNKIRGGQLEEGMYDLSLTEQFGPIDKDADAYRNWARLYVTGASFWELDWVQVINYFQQVYAAVPMMIDSSGMTASERYRKALIAYGDKLASEENYCEAQQQYELALQVSPGGGLGPKATQNERLCHPETATPKAPTLAPTDSELPTIEPTSKPVEPTAEPDTPEPKPTDSAPTPETGQTPPANP